MAAERCPLCQSKLKGGECPSCGYRPPDESDISALYNYDPTDYPQPEQQAVREIMPDVQMEEIYPGRPEIPNIKVHDQQNKTVGVYGTGANQEAWQKAKQAEQARQAKQAEQVQQAQQRAQKNSQNPYADNGSFRPYQSPPTAKNIPTNLPTILGGNLPSPNSSDTVNSYGDFFRKYWWALLLSLFIPFLGLIFYAIFKDKLEKKYNILFIVVFFLRIFFPF